jgi:hypothetical protein
VSHLDLMPARSPALGRAIDADTLLRTFILAAVFLLLWISFRPFQSLADPPQVIEQAAGGLNQANAAQPVARQDQDLACGQ